MPAEVLRVTSRPSGTTGNTKAQVLTANCDPALANDVTHAGRRQAAHLLNDFYSSILPRRTVTDRHLTETALKAGQQYRDIRRVDSGRSSGVELIRARGRTDGG